VVLKRGRFGQQIRNTWKVLKCGAGEGDQRGRSCVHEAVLHTVRRHSMCVLFANDASFFFLSLQLATWRLYNYLNLVPNHFVCGGHKMCVM
jgi:hypothetical protein